MFAEIADLMEILEGDRFRINSYRNASRAIAGLAQAVEDLAKEGRLEEIPGVGKSTAAKVQEFLSTGKVAALEELLAKCPPGLPGMMRVPGLGPKTIFKLWKEAGITSLEQLKEACEKTPQKLLEMPGMGEKKIAQLRQSLAFVESTGQRVRLGEASELAAELAAAVKKSAGARRVEVAGSLRRGRETIGDIDLLCEARQEDAAAIIETFAQAPRVKRVLAKGQTKGSVIVTGDIQADLRVVEARSFGAAWCYFTGSKAHNVRLREIAIGRNMKLNEYGLFEGDKAVAAATEEEIYKALGLAFVPPEMREDAGEIQASASGKLPKLVGLADIKGDMHMHTKASDGQNTIEEMIDACRARGYKYMAITDHSKTQRQAGGLDEVRVLEHAGQIHQAAKKYPDMLVLAGAEVDLLKDGTLAFAKEVCEQLDFVIASCHEALKMEKEPATKRIIKAIDSGCVHCIGHPSGRLINERPGMELDIDKIAQAAAANGVALEINAHPYRLDLRDTHVRAAVAAGAKIIISTDAHGIGNLDLMHFGVATARRGWATCEDVVNTWNAAKFKAWLSK